MKNDKYADDVLIAIRRIIRSVDIHSRELLRTVGLTGPQLVVLRDILSHDRSSISELSKRVSLSQATVTAILDRLESKGYVLRERAQEDRRKTWVKATREGTRLAKSGPSLLQENFLERFNNLEDWEQTQLLTSLNRVCSMMESPHDVADSAPLLSSGPLSASSEESKAYLEGRKPKSDV